MVCPTMPSFFFFFCCFIVSVGLIHGRSPDDGSMSPVDSPPAMNPSGVACNKTNYTAVYPTDSYVRHVLDQLGKEVGKTKHYAKLINFPEIDTPILSGEGACTRSLSPAACARCLKDGARKVLASCHHRVGARFNATACRLRYDVY